jgi:hypothetical protein
VTPRVVVAVMLAAGLAGCGAVSSPTPIPTPLDHSVDVDPAKTPPGVVSYISRRGSPVYGGSVEDSVEIRAAQDLGKLRGAPADFKAFLLREIADRGNEVDARLAARHRTVATEGCDFKVEIRVWGIAEQVATGRERACTFASNDVIWVREDGTWRRASRMQGGWDCAELERYRVPADITAAVCWYGDRGQTRVYDGPRPHRSGTE